MTPTQIARRSDALYADGTRGMTRRVLCDMVAQRESDLEDARAENAKLRKLAIIMWPVFIGMKRATFADRLRARHEIDELGIDELGIEVDG